MGNRYLFEPFGDHHREYRKGFSCGKEPLDDYLRTKARQEMSSGVCAVYVLFDLEKQRIAGYYTLSNSSLVSIDLPDEAVRRLPRYPALPATLVGRLALDTRYAGTGLGKELLKSALETALGASRASGSVFVVVDALDDDARSFYEHYGFTRLDSEDGEPRLFLAMETIKESLRPSTEARTKDE